LLHFGGQETEQQHTANDIINDNTALYIA